MTSPDPVTTYDTVCDICDRLRRCERVETALDTYIYVCSTCHIGTPLTGGQS